MIAVVLSLTLVHVIAKIYSMAMKRKYYFHRIGQPLQADHVIYRLWVGESVREQRLLTQLVAWAFAHGATLLSWSEDIDYFLDFEASRVFPGRGLLDFGFIQHDITASEALKHVKADDWDMFEKTLPQPKGFFSALSLNNPSRIEKKSSQITPSRVLTEKSKNLSQRGENQRFIISFV